MDGGKSVVIQAQRLVVYLFKNGKRQLHLVLALREVVEVRVLPQFFPHLWIDWALALFEILQLWHQGIGHPTSGVVAEVNVVLEALGKMPGESMREHLVWTQSSMSSAKHVLAGNKVDILWQLVFPLFDLLNHSVSNEFVVLHDGYRAELIFDWNVVGYEQIHDLLGGLNAVHKDFLDSLLQSTLRYKSTERCLSLFWQFPKFTARFWLFLISWQSIEWLLFNTHCFRK